MKNKMTKESPTNSGESNQTIDIADTSCSNTGTIHIGKGTDNSVTTKFELRDSSIYIHLGSVSEVDIKRAHSNCHIVPINGYALNSIAQSLATLVDVLNEFVNKSTHYTKPH